MILYIFLVKTVHFIVISLHLDFFFRILCWIYTVQASGILIYDLIYDDMKCILIIILYWFVLFPLSNRLRPQRLGTLVKPGMALAAPAAA